MARNPDPSAVPTTQEAPAMTTNGHTDARTLHNRLRHPVIDADGHWIEYGPIMKEEFRRIGGDPAAEALAVATQRVPNALSLSVAERGRRRVGQESFWSSPSENVLDRATAMLPRLMYERLDDLGIDFSVVYPTAGLSFHRMQDTRLRRAICRAYNVFAADQFRGLGDRVIPAAIIPMYTPEEAIEELEYAVTQLGYKVAMVGGLMRRRVPALEAEQPEASKHVEWYDVIGIDSPHDYDPVWQKCRELRVAPSFHNGARSILLRNSPSNFCYNHIGHFASAGHAVCKALFFGGVTRRFPDLNFAFLEGGVGWACMLYADLIGHWEKRTGGDRETNPPDSTSGLLEWRGVRQRGGGGRSGPWGRPRWGLELTPHRRSRGPGRLLPVPDREEGGHSRPLRPALLFRLRGGRSGQCLGLQHQGKSHGGAPQRALQLGHRPLRRARHGRGRSRGLRARGARAHHRRRLPRLHVRQRRALLG
jgi:predicted TIM-barrel fold metal-dependent hydrolase